MRVCDRCLAHESSKVEVLFDKEDSRKRSNRRRILNVKMDLCETCIDEFLKAFGHFKLNFLKEGDEESEPPKKPSKVVAPRGTKRCRCRHDETCGAEFESHHLPGEMTCCPECGKQQDPLVIA